MKINIFILFYFLLLVLLTVSESKANEYSHCGNIIIDGYFEDWTGVTIISDSENDANGKIDLLELKLSQDDDYFFFYLKFSSEFNIQESNQIQMYFDCDNNVNTGEYFKGIGSDLIWNFGEKSGTYYLNNNTYYFKHSILEICGLPSITSSEFEFAISKNCIYLNQKIFSSEKFKLVLSTDIGGDIVPDIAIGEITFVKAECDQIPLIPIEIEKENIEYLRLLSWNCLQDNLSQSNLTNIFQKIIKIVSPDIIGFQELYETDETFLINFLKNAFPNENWYVKKQPFTDIVLASKYPIIQSQQIDGNAAFLIYMQERFGVNALIVNAHLPASQENAKRLAEISKIVNFIRSVKNNSSDIKIEKNSPIFILGDMNLVGLSEQLKLLLTGNTKGTNPDIDWDSTSFAEANPRLTESPFCYTWTKSYSNFWPGKLDYIIYSDYSAILKKAFSINTEKMSQNNIQKYGLNTDDSPKATDHLPIIADFKINDFNSICLDNNLTDVYYNSNNNSLTNNTIINYQFRIIDILGNTVGDGHLLSGFTESLPGLAKGIYFITLYSINYNSKPIIIRVWNSGFPSVISPILNKVPRANQN